MTNLDSITELTEFAPLNSEVKQSTVSSLFNKFFRFSQDSIPENEANENTQNVENQLSSISNTIDPKNATNKETGIMQTMPSFDQYAFNLAETRTLPNVLRRVSNLLALRNKNSPAYKDTNLKQYWMPDSISKECYDCSEKFTTFRRKHHCRVCGQIFCSRCCNQGVPGKILGCSGDLRVCTYCCKVVLSYLQSSDIEAELSADLRALQDDLQSRFGNEYLPALDEMKPAVVSSNSYNTQSDNNLVKRRKISCSYQEERFISERNNEASCNDNESDNSAQVSTLNNLVEQIMHPQDGLQLQLYVYREKTYDLCFFGSQLIDWLISQKKTSSRTHSLAICQVLLDANYIEDIQKKSNSFIDGPTVYRFSKTADRLNSQLTRKNGNDELSLQDNKRNIIASDNNGPFSQSVFHLDLNIHTNTAYISRTYKGNTKSDKKRSSFLNSDEFKVDGVLYNFLQQQSVKLSQIFPVNWSTIDCDSITNNDTRLVYQLLSDLFSQHIQSAVRQLLSYEGLSLSWADIIIPLTECAVKEIQLDYTKTDIFDIRQYIQIKKVPEGDRECCDVIGGVVCTKNIAHREMFNRLENPRILLLQCAIVYQRVEGRLMSLEPVMLQEHEYLRHAVARIASLNPDLVLVQKNVSRIAQESLTALGITLVLNVKYTVLERIARCTNADIVTSLDVYVGKPQLGACRSFRTENYTFKNGESKTLMFFEGCAFPQLGCTILLRGGSITELSKLKSVVNFTTLLIYNSKLERSFLLDEFAKPMKSSQCTFLADNSSSFDTDNKQHRKQTEDKTVKCSKSEIIEEKKVTSKLISDDDDDPLHVHLKKEDYHEQQDHHQQRDDDPLNEEDTAVEVNTDLALSEVSLNKNKFREALRDTVLCISPLIMFDVPYLETEVGRNCELRKLFPSELYYSIQLGNMKNSIKSSNFDVTKSTNKAISVTDVHPFVSEKLKDSSEKENVQELIAMFRASGGRRRIISKNMPSSCKELKLNGQKNHNEFVDVLDPRNRQHIYVLFCSFSTCSNNSPGFCVNPWVVNMDFYGQNDIPLGSFLAKYCFRESYVCPSNSCDTPIMDHERRFVHGNGCIHVTLHEMVGFSEKPSQSILSWSYCSICKISTPVTAMSNDTWGLSFAKYLELRFYGTKYVCRTVNEDECQHLLHHNFYQYFFYNNIVAIFRNSTISLWEISFPPLVLRVPTIKFDMASVLDQIKQWSLMGHEVFSSILEKLYSLENDSTSTASSSTMQGMKFHLTKQQAAFKQNVEAIQVSLSSFDLDDTSEPSDKQIYAELCKLEDSIVLLKRSVAEILYNWNALFHKLDVKKPKTKSSSLSSSQVTDDNNGTAILDEQQPQKSKIIDESEVSTDDCFEDTEKFWKRFSQMPFFATNEITSDDPASDKTQKLDEEKDCRSIFYSNDSNSDENTSELRVEKANISDQAAQPPLMSSHANESIVNQVSQPSDKIKALLPQFLLNSFNSSTNVLSNPINPNEHYLLNVSCSLPIVVYENEPGSIIAYTLSTYHYQHSLENLQKQITISSDHFVVGRTISGSSSKKENTDNIAPVLVRNNESVLSSEGEETGKPDMIEDKSRSGKLQDHMHIDVTFSDSTAYFSVRVYFAQQFAYLRTLVFPAGEEAYIRSLCRCIQWAAHGGKSGSAFCKTKDDRFVLKQMSRLEIQSFVEFAPHYFNFINSCYTSNKPTLLGKIVGVYRVKCRPASANTTSQSNLLVIENLFYRRNIVRKFDLKGSVRNRLADTDVSHEGELVLLDENLINMTCESPLYIYPHFKTVLIQAINNDVTFLASQSVMDYSLLVGLDESKLELVVGIIDYIRTFTWDKKLETMVKKSGILGGQGKLPTIVSPEEYKNRFIAAMHKYFLSVPDQWYKCEKDCDY